jgi:hypothetical protein
VSLVAMEQRCRRLHGEQFGDKKYFVLGTGYVNQRGRRWSCCRKRAPRYENLTKGCKNTGNVCSSTSRPTDTAKGGGYIYCYATHAWQFYVSVTSTITARHCERGLVSRHIRCVGDNPKIQQTFASAYLKNILLVVYRFFSKILD